MAITEWDIQDRPREKMMANGTASLSNAELLAIILVTGKRGATAVDMARKLLNDCDNSLLNLEKTLLPIDKNTDDEVVSDSACQELMKGIGMAKICQVQAALELGRRRQREWEEQKLNKSVIDSADKIFTLFNQDLSNLDHEELWAVYCSRNGKVLCKKRISEGGVDFSGCDLKKVCKPAILYMASAVALCHNHPHSNPHPSRQDIDITQKVKEALHTIDVRLLDHIIIADGKYYSLLDNGYI